MALRANASEAARSMPDGYLAMMPVKAGRSHPRQSRNDSLSLKRLSERRVRWLTDAPLAAEARMLAQRSSAATKEIKELIETSSGKVQAGGTLVTEAGGQFTLSTRAAQTARDHLVRLARSPTQHEFRKGLRVKRAADQITLNGIASGVLQFFGLALAFDAFRDSLHAERTSETDNASDDRRRLL